MNARVPPPEMDAVVPAPDPAGEPAADARMLARLAEIGMDLAEALRREALARAAAAEAGAGATGGGGGGAPAMPAPGNDLGQSFARLTRAVRLTLALKKKWAEERQAEVQAA